MNDIFTQVVELGVRWDWGSWGHVAIDSRALRRTRHPSFTDSIEKLRAERAKIRKNIRGGKHREARIRMKERLEVARRDGKARRAAS